MIESTLLNNHQLIPFAPTILRPPRLGTTSFLVALRYATSMTLRPLKPLLHLLRSSLPHYEYADGMAYRRLIALASLSMAISDGNEILIPSM